MPHACERTSRQVQQAGHTLFVVHRFRNAAVAWLTERRRRRAAWLKANRGQPKGSMPAELAGSDALACSKRLTEQLVRARDTVRQELGVQAGRNDLGTALAQAWPHLSRGERESLGDPALWLTVSRTVLDQVLRDLEKTIAKAIQDRVDAKKQRDRDSQVTGQAAGSQKTVGSKVSLPEAFAGRNGARAKGSTRQPKPAGFPTFHKWSHAGSFRMQMEASKNRSFRDHWAAGELFLPGLGRLRFRDHQALPATPPKLITLARDAAGRWHVSFLCVGGEGRSQERQRKLFAQPLVRDAVTGMPACGSADAGIKDSLIGHAGKRSGPGRYLRRQLKQLGHLQRELSRKVKGSSRWKKTKQRSWRVEAWSAGWSISVPVKIRLWKRVFGRAHRCKGGREPFGNDEAEILVTKLCATLGIEASPTRITQVVARYLGSPRASSAGGVARSSLVSWRRPSTVEAWNTQRQEAKKATQTDRRCLFLFLGGAFAVPVVGALIQICWPHSFAATKTLSQTCFALGVTWLSVCAGVWHTWPRLRRARAYIRDVLGIDGLGLGPATCHGPLTDLLETYTPPPEQIRAWLAYPESRAAWLALNEQKVPILLLDAQHLNKIWLLSKDSRA